MMSYNTFENYDDALFHGFANGEKYKKDLNDVFLLEGLNETLLSDFPFEKNEVLKYFE